MNGPFPLAEEINRLRAENEALRRACDYIAIRPYIGSGSAAMGEGDAEMTRLGLAPWSVASAYLIARNKVAA